MRNFIKLLQFTPYDAEPDVWKRKDIKKGRSLYWEYIVLYTDDVLVLFLTKGKRCCDLKLEKNFNLKESIIKPLYIYLVGKVQKRIVQGTDGDVHAWSFIFSHYVQNAVKNVDKYLHEVEHNGMQKSMDSPIFNGYQEEIDKKSELEPDYAAYYQSLIGVLRRIFELGQVDINFKVSFHICCVE